MCTLYPSTISLDKVHFHNGITCTTRKPLNYGGRVDLMNLDPLPVIARDIRSKPQDARAKLFKWIGLTDFPPWTIGCQLIKQMFALVLYRKGNTEALSKATGQNNHIQTQKGVQGSSNFQALPSWMNQRSRRLYGFRGVRP